MTTKVLMIALAAGGAAAALGGCATMPAATPFWLTGTSWAITDVNRADTSARTDFTVRFTGSRFDARFGCRRATGDYVIRYGPTGDGLPIFDASNAVISGKACTGLFAETIGPEIISNSPLTLQQATDGRLSMLEPPTGISLRPLAR